MSSDPLSSPHGQETGWLADQHVVILGALPLVADQQWVQDLFCGTTVSLVQTTVDLIKYTWGPVTPGWCPV